MRREHTRTRFRMPPAHGGRPPPAQPDKDLRVDLHEPRHAFFVSRDPNTAFLPQRIWPASRAWSTWSKNQVRNVGPDARKIRVRTRKKSETGALPPLGLCPYQGTTSPLDPAMPPALLGGAGGKTGALRVASDPQTTTRRRKGTPTSSIVFLRAGLTCRGRRNGGGSKRPHLGGAVR